jgi:hypothetical protein
VALATISAFALEKRLLRWLKYKVERKPARDDACGKAAIGQSDEAPVLDANISVTDLCLRNAKTAARRTLIMEQFTN